jgi:hypothetical protein
MSIALIQSPTQATSNKPFPFFLKKNKKKQVTAWNP